MRVRACAKSRACGDGEKGLPCCFICLGDPTSLAPNSRTCCPFEPSDDRAADLHWTSVTMYCPRVAEGAHSAHPRSARTRHKGPVRAGPRLGSPSIRAPKSVHTHPLGGGGGIFSDLQGPGPVGGGGRGKHSKSAIGHLILIHLGKKNLYLLCV